MILLLGFVLTSCADSNVIVPSHLASESIISFAENPVSSLPSSSQLSELTPEPEPVLQSIRFSAVGDNLIHKDLYYWAGEKAGANDAYDFTFCYEHCAYFFKNYDVNWINQESLVSDTLPAATYPTFSTPGALGRAAYAAGWRVFALSNNHSYDQGAKGIDETLAYWANMPDDVVAYGIYPEPENRISQNIALQQVNGITIAYVAFTDGTNGLPTPQHANARVIYTRETGLMEQMVRTAREMADVVITSVHWGTENSHQVNSAQKLLAQNLADWGSDIVIGTHPHVVQELAWLQSQEDGRKVLVAYSLGNFLASHASPTPSQAIGIALTFQLNRWVQPDGTTGPIEIEEVAVHPTVTQYESASPRKIATTYMLADYTEDMAKKHILYGKTGGAWTTDYIQNVIKKYIPPEFLSQTSFYSDIQIG